ncbi:MAG: response regulator transcription factor [Defluviitaleaceae bacterium]|nr:response regulator transcription factor [Defluviitaleaceae bacterium]
MATKILVVDDEKLIVKGIKYSLEQDGMEVTAAHDGEEAVEYLKSNKYDIVVLDVMLPKFDGMEVLRQMREFCKTPVIMVTAKGEDMDKIMGFEHGADDYLTKPFNILELKARIKAILRRSAVKNPGEKPQKLVYGELEINGEARSAHIGGKPVNLTAKEFDLLLLFMQTPGKVYSRENLRDIVWGANGRGQSSLMDVRTVDVHIRRLREKIEADPGAPKYIVTKWSIGYYFNAEQSADADASAGFLA